MTSEGQLATKYRHSITRERFEEAKALIEAEQDISVTALFAADSGGYDVTRAVELTLDETGGTLHFRYDRRAKEECFRYVRADVLSAHEWQCVFSALREFSMDLDDVLKKLQSALQLDDDGNSSFR